MAKPLLKIVSEYTTSLIPVTRLEEIEMFEYSNEYQELNDNAKAYLIGRQNDNGGWDIISKLFNADEGVVYEDLSFEQMIVQLARGEDIFLMSEPYNALNLDIFYPQNPHLIPADEEIFLLKRYINATRPPRNHICNLMLQIGREKRENDKLNQMLDNNKYMSDPEEQLYRPSVPGVQGQKLFLN